MTGRARTSQETESVTISLEPRPESASHPRSSLTKLVHFSADVQYLYGLVLGLILGLIPKSAESPCELLHPVHTPW
ncbi:uncharacterized protein BO88DRAFT_189971 [Aspergillus vadensis CBS 113365]|uniref:Uncharacterized protein n=1 Tax=Aspergillus vadensis (strain CBS 113365 / IMI 142717 / IBT 24658) TaxID=1448311 RepID=A0A319AUD3_ASPVC|nr:hypothetical protein BO88DRAFT_189971 [Aspergillus vadensis CBS 113365]PYH63946.1 hypothetical protein BO88DRAFT_189971 [Aspergillus vadensis CBS 113365]